MTNFNIMTELLRLHPESDHPQMLHNFKIALALGYDKQKAKLFAAALVNDKTINLSHLKAYEITLFSNE